MRKSRVKQRLRTLAHGLCLAALAALCIWCTADNLLPILRTHGRTWLLYSAGLRPVSSPSSFPLPSPSPASTPEPNALLFPPDSPLAVWQEPVPVTTPDPNRETGTVEILRMNPGKTVDCFTVKDETGTGLDLEQELQIAPALDIRRDGTPMVLLYSTHTTESYILEGSGDWYYLDDDFRSLDPTENVVSVAAEAAKVIEAGGFGVIHDTTVHDNPAYSGSYARSMETIEKNLEAHPTIQITIDVHRDAFGQSGTTMYKPVAEINGQSAAQIMLLTGCDLSEDPLFPGWRDNLHLALRLQQKGETLFPGLYRPLYFCRRNYNLHATPGSLLAEIGTDVNTLREAQYAGRLLGETVLAVLNDLAAE